MLFRSTAPLLVAGVPVDLPESRANALTQEANQVTLAIDAQGQVFLDDAPIAPGELPERINALRCIGRGTGQSAAERPLITLRADRALDYGRVMAVMGELNRAGCNSVSLVTSSSGVTGGSSREPEPLAEWRFINPHASTARNRSASSSRSRCTPGWSRGWRWPRRAARFSPRPSG